MAQDTFGGSGKCSHRGTLSKGSKNTRPWSKQITVAVTLKHEEFRSQCTFLNAKMPPLENSTKNPITRRAHVFRPGVCSRCIFPIRKCPSWILVHIDPEAGGGAISVCANATVFLQQNQDNSARPLWAKQKMFQRLGITRYLHTSISVEIAISFPSMSEIYLCVFLSLSCTISLSLSPPCFCCLALARLESSVVSHFHGTTSLRAHFLQRLSPPARVFFNSIFSPWRCSPQTAGHTLSWKTSTSSPTRNSLTTASLKSALECLNRRVTCNRTHIHVVNIN